MRIETLSSFIFAMLILSSSGCSFNPEQQFDVKSLAKSELDMVIDAHLKQTNQYAIDLMKKLYKRNPKELAKAPKGTTLNKRTEQLFSFPRQVQFNELGNKYANSALLNAFDENYQGDRVFSFMAGITGIIHSSYNFQSEFFMLDTINEQRIYNSARNLETADWLLNSSKDKQLTLYLLSNSYSDKAVNLSFERLFGKMIAGQDILAEIIANRNNRTINKVLHGFASTTLIPI
jgi:hypothetical protein